AAAPVAILLANFAKSGLSAGQLFMLAGGATVGVAQFSAFFLPMGIAPAAYAAEREKHTLETLLSTRLSDRAIYWGKLLSVVALGVLLGLAAGLLALIILAILLGHWLLFLLWVAILLA